MHTCTRIQQGSSSTISNFYYVEEPKRSCTHNCVYLVIVLLLIVVHLLVVGSDVIGNTRPGLVTITLYMYIYMYMEQEKNYSNYTCKYI